jgi:hypothetical protein
MWPEDDGSDFDMEEATREEERERAVQAVMDLFFALKHIGGEPTLRDLVKLAKRIRRP